MAANARQLYLRTDVTIRKEVLDEPSELKGNEVGLIEHPAVSQKTIQVEIVQINAPRSKHLGLQAIVCRMSDFGEDLTLGSESKRQMCYASSSQAATR